jgi:hypothetical protein
MYKKPLPVDRALTPGGLLLVTLPFGEKDDQRATSTIKVYKAW